MLDRENSRYSPNISPVAPSSRSPHVSYLDRIDPLHEIAFKDVVGSRWDSVSIIQHALALSPNGALVHGNKAYESPISMSPERSHNPWTIRVMASLNQFHQLTSRQITTLAGGEVKKVATALDRLYAAGVIQRSNNYAWPHAEEDTRDDFGVGAVWQLNHNSPNLIEWYDELDDLEYLLMSGGRDLLKPSNGSTGSSSIRHNLMLSEIIIRAMEMCPGVLGGWGEPMTTSNLFTDSFEGRMRQNIADGAIIAKDGSIVLIETSGVANLDRESYGNKLSDKALAWAAIAARSDLPLKIVFVNIAPAARMIRFNYHIEKGANRIDELIVKSASQRKGKEAIYVANALDWFPFILGISQGFSELEAQSVVTRRYHPLIPADTPFDSKPDIIANTLGALHIPTWVAKLKGESGFGPDSTEMKRAV